MSSTVFGASLAECVAPLDDEDRRAVRRYWEQVIREEWTPPAERVQRVSLAESEARRERRAQRAIARLTAGRVLSVSVSDAAGLIVGGVSAGVAA